MRTHLLFFSFIFLMLGCNTRSNDNSIPISSTKSGNDKKFRMYEMSEMSILMEQMYVDNERLKVRIKNGELFGDFPKHFLKIHKAVMTDAKENDVFFKTQASNFIKNQKLIYKDPKYSKEHFNDAINACVKCHEVKCVGPIPRINKLYIE